MGFQLPFPQLVIGGFLNHQQHESSSHSTCHSTDIWVFPKIGVKPPKWMVKIMENPLFFNG